MIRNFLFLLLLITFLKGLVWAAVVPMWHTPDEQAHFANIEFIAEKKRLPNYILFPGVEAEKNLSKELLISEQLLGTERDQAGNNKFTYHPEYNIAYQDGSIGKYENQIKNIPVSWRSEMVKSEPANYPPLYYLGGTAVYLLFYQTDLFTRVFIIRLFSILMFALTVFFSFKIAEELFPKDLLSQMAIPILVSFQPMFNFVGSGVNSDNLINLLFTIFIYQGLRVIKKGFSPRLSGMMGAIIGLGVLTKPQFFIPLPIVIILFLYEVRKKDWRALILNFSLLTFNFILFGGWWVVRLYLAVGTPLSGGWSAFTNPYSSLSLFEYLKTSLTRLIRETIPWYWGVFKWLGVTLPRLANQILMRLGFLAILGLFFWLIRLIKQRKIGFQEKGIIFIFLLNLIYIGALYLVDFIFLRSYGFFIGMQGRYFFPLISTQMVFFLWGIINLFPQKWLKARKFAIISLCLGMVSLNFVALATVFSAYYPITGWERTLEIVSQYKPWFIKGYFFVLILFFYLVSLGWFLKIYVQNYLRQPANQS